MQKLTWGAVALVMGGSRMPQRPGCADSAKPTPGAKALEVAALRAAVSGPAGLRRL